MATGKPSDPATQARILALKIKAQVERAAGKGLNAAGVFLVARIKETVSVAAPTKLVKGPNGTRRVATTRATPGAPPRVVSGKLRSGLAHAVVGTNVLMLGSIAKSPKGFHYPVYHEKKAAGYPGSGKHPYMRVTFNKYKAEIFRIMGKELRVIT